MSLTPIISSNYIINIHSNNKLQYSDPTNYKQAEAVLILTGAGPSAGETITLKATNLDLISTKSLIYTAHSSESLAARKFDVSGTNQETVASLGDCIAHSSGHNGLIIVVAKVQNSENNWTLVLRQFAPGPDSNWGIANTLSNVSDGGFKGGEKLISGVNTLPFRFDFLGPPNLRGQTTDKKYKTFLGEQKL